MQAVFLLIGKTSALTMNIAGVIKDWMLIFCSYYLFGAPVTAINLLGYVFCCSGVNFPAALLSTWAPSPRLGRWHGMPCSCCNLACNLPHARMHVGRRAGAVMLVGQTGMGRGEHGVACLPAAGGDLQLHEAAADQGQGRAEHRQGRGEDGRGWVSRHVPACALSWPHGARPDVCVNMPHAGAAEQQPLLNGNMHATTKSVTSDGPPVATSTFAAFRCQSLLSVHSLLSAVVLLGAGSRDGNL